MASTFDLSFNPTVAIMIIYQLLNVRYDINNETRISVIKSNLGDDTLTRNMKI